MPSTSTSTPVPILIGRERELSALRAHLSAPSLGKIVTLVGVAGVGKSTLAAAFAIQHGQAFGESRVVDLSGPCAVIEVARRVARTCDIRFARGGGDLLARVAEALSQRKVGLIVLDDVEDVAAVRPLVQRLVEKAEHLRLLVTSRTPLGLDGEVVLEVAPLSVDDATRLFVDRVRARGRDANLDDGAVRAIAARLDGLPLAVVLAAGRSSVLSLDVLLDRLDQPLRVLREPNGGASAGRSARHATLEDAIDSSFFVLTGDERAALSCAAVFEGAFTADAFEAVAGPELAADPLDSLEGLLRHSLLERHGAAGAVRFRMLHVVRAFARERDRERGPNAERAMRYEAHVSAAAAELARHSYGKPSDRALSELEDMLPDVLAAFASAVHDRPARAAALWLALFDAILFREVVSLDDPRFSMAVDAADRATDRGDSGASARVRTRVLRARAALELGPPESAGADLTDALAIAGEDARLVAEVRRSLGWMALAAGDPEAALRELDRAMTASVALRDTRGHADALAAMGLAETLRGRADVGRESLGLARALHAQASDELRRRRVDDMLRLLGHEVAEEDPSAEQALLLSAARHEARGQSFRVALDYALLSHLESARGDQPSAAEHRLRARAAARAAGLSAIEEAITKENVPKASEPPWILGDEARSLTRPDGVKLDLVRHGSLRLVLEALVDARLGRAGVALSATSVLEAGWPGERVLHDAGLLRVYSAIRRLRRMGLEAVLITRDDGYLLDPSMPIERR